MDLFKVIFKWKGKKKKKRSVLKKGKNTYMYFLIFAKRNTGKITKN